MKIIDYDECPICGNLGNMIEVYDEVERKGYKACEACITDGLVMLISCLEAEKLDA